MEKVMRKVVKGSCVRRIAAAAMAVSMLMVTACNSKIKVDYGYNPTDYVLASSCDRCWEPQYRAAAYWSHKASTGTAFSRFRKCCHRAAFGMRCRLPAWITVQAKR